MVERKTPDSEVAGSNPTGRREIPRDLPIPQRCEYTKQDLKEGRMSLT